MHGARPPTSRDGVFDSSALSCFKGHVATWQLHAVASSKAERAHRIARKTQEAKVWNGFCIMHPCDVFGRQSFLRVDGVHDTRLVRISACLGRLWGVLNAQHVEDKALYRSQATRDWGTSPSNATLSTGGGKRASKC